MILEGKIYVYGMTDLKLIESYETKPNPYGICALSSVGDPILVYPGKNPGILQIKSIEKEKVLTVEAHKSDIGCLILSNDGKLLATASKKGTLIRVFDTDTGKKIKELRRGADKAVINSIALDNGNKLLACTSEKGTVHVFNLSAAQVSKEEAKNHTSVYSYY